VFCAFFVSYSLIRASAIVTRLHPLVGELALIDQAKGSKSLAIEGFGNRRRQIELGLRNESTHFVKGDAMIRPSA
jgi:hypothetical protein